MQKIAQRGWLLPFVPTEHRPHGQDGKADWDIFHAMIVSCLQTIRFCSHWWLQLQEEAHRSPCIGPIWGLFCGVGIGLSVVVHFGSEQQRKRFLPDGYTGKARWCLGVTEPEGGVRLFQTKKHPNLNFALFCSRLRCRRH